MKKLKKTASDPFQKRLDEFMLKLQTHQNKHPSSVADVSDTCERLARRNHDVYGIVYVQVLGIVLMVSSWNMGVLCACFVRIFPFF